MKFLVWYILSTVAYTLVLFAEQLHYLPEIKDWLLDTERVSKWQYLKMLRTTDDVFLKPLMISSIKVSWCPVYRFFGIISIAYVARKQRNKNHER